MHITMWQLTSLMGTDGRLTSNRQKIIKRIWHGILKTIY
ncbi:hypothetical protein ALT721_30003 [Alteromonas alvinellae]